MKLSPKEIVKGRMDGNTNRRKKEETNQKECIKKQANEKKRKKWENTR